MTTHTQPAWVSRPARSDRAVVLCTDGRAYPVAELVARRISRLEPELDVVLCIEDTAVVPERLRDATIRHCVLAPDPRLETLPLTANKPRAIYDRLLLADQLGNDYRRILYVDFDVLVTKAGISGMISADMHGAAIAAAPDLLAAADPPANLRDAYRNAGVLLLDCESGGAQKAFAEALAFALANPEKLPPYHDQSALNFALKGQMALLSPRWNFVHSPRLAPFADIVDPVVLHFAGPVKPWGANEGLGKLAYHDTFMDGIRDLFTDVELTAFGFRQDNDASRPHSNPLWSAWQSWRSGRRQVANARKRVKRPPLDPATIRRFITEADIP